MPTQEQVLIHTLSADTATACGDCGNTAMHPNILRTAYNSEHRRVAVCADCLDATYPQCTDCSNHCEDVQEYPLGRGGSEIPLCSNCIAPCADCGDNYRVERSGGCNSSDESICESCAANYFYCERCSCTYHNNDYGGDGNCQSCFDSLHEEEEEEEDSDGIYPYEHKPEIRYTYGVASGKTARTDYISTKLKESTLFLGLELEHEFGDFTPSKCVSSLSNLFGHSAIYKHDGSVSDGAEIVTQPFTLSAFPFEELKKHLELLKENGAKAYDARSSCGIHVHVSRRPFTATILGQRQYVERFQTFFDKCEDRLKAVSKRKSFSYCEFGELTNGRYRAVNFQNGGTIEYRFPRATLNYKSASNYIKLCAHISYFVLTYTLSNMKLRTGGDLWRLFLSELPLELKKWTVKRSYNHDSE